VEKIYFFLFVTAIGIAAACGIKDDSTVDIEEIGQQVGDVMASVDESGGSGGTIAYLDSTYKTFARVAPSEVRPSWANWPSWIEHLIEPSAFAASCVLSSTFGSCSSNVITRSFGGCTVLGTTLSGTVALTWAGTSTNCQMQAVNDYLTRSPSFTITGRRGATLTVTKSGTYGQKITWTGGLGTSKTFSFTSDGIQRVFTSSDGSKLFDYTTAVTSTMTITGTSRSNRTISGGNLQVTNNLTSVSCNFVPSGIEWTSTCNCPTAGSWTASCTDGKSSTLKITGCGSATLTLGDSTQNFTFDRCYGI
jgi:hypothetical protein